MRTNGKGLTSRKGRPYGIYTPGPTTSPSVKVKAMKPSGPRGPLKAAKPKGKSDLSYSYTPFSDPHARPATAVLGKGRLGGRAVTAKVRKPLRHLGPR
jgi:hypothetical protein